MDSDLLEARENPRQILELHEQSREWKPNPYASQAQQHTVAWLDSYGILTPRIKRYATMAAWVWPRAGLPELELLSDKVAFFRVFDDFSDDVGADVCRVLEISSELTSVLYGATPTSQTSQIGWIFHDVWQREMADSPGSWVARARSFWEWYFSTQAEYSAMLDQRQQPTVEEYLEQRAGNGAIPLSFVMGEKGNSTYLPPHIHHCTQLRLMRKVASDITVYCNDVYSSVRDAENNDLRNLVAITQRRKECSWREAVEVCERRMRELGRTMANLQERLQMTCNILYRTADERAAVVSGADIINDWVWGYQAWASPTEILMDQDPPSAKITQCLLAPPCRSGE